MNIVFCGMSGPGSFADLDELFTPIREYIDKIVWVLHDCNDQSVESLYFKGYDSKLGNPEVTVINLPFSRRHDFARNAYLYCGGINTGDWILTCDSLERIAPEFAQNAPKFIIELEDMGVEMATYFGKPILFKYSEALYYEGSPHEGLRSRQGNIPTIELNHIFKDESKVRVNMRPIKRSDPFHFVGHYAKYFIDYPIGSNHCLLGLENRPGNLYENFNQRETLRLDFREYLRQKNIPVRAKYFQEWLIENKNNLDQKMKYFLSNEKILNDLWRYHVLGDRNFKDDHDWKNVVKID